MRDIFLALAVLLFAFLYTTSQKEYASGAGQVSGPSGGGTYMNKYAASLSGQYKENNPNLARRVAGVFMYKSPSDWPFKVSPGTSMAVTGRGPNGIPHV